tara:strand:+ start:240 stop:677 length:438 start_codon:yes stop_codon:yes gene_type:complete
MAKRKVNVRARAIKHGYRSGLEETIADQLKKYKIEYEYENKANTIKYTIPAKDHTYLPDFKLPNGIIIETKGRFVLADRKKHEMIKQQHPEKDIRFVFSNSSTRISKKSKTTYGMWCEKLGIIYADKLIPLDWFLQPSVGSSNKK